MRLGVISDLHIDLNKDLPIAQVLAQKAAEKKLDALLIAGDIANRQPLVFAFLGEMEQRTGLPVYFVPGNHDLWDEAGFGADSRVIYQRYADHPRCLTGKRILLGERWAMVGDAGWYDYSFANPRFTEADFARHELEGRVWQDSRFVIWGKEDKAVHREMLGRLAAALEGSKQKQLVAVTHMVSTLAFAVPESWGNWAYFNAFLGSRQYGELYQKYENVKYSVMGHVHFRGEKEEGNLWHICACLGYVSEWKSADLALEIEQSLAVLTLD